MLRWSSCCSIRLSRAYGWEHRPASTVATFLENKFGLYKYGPKFPHLLQPRDGGRPNNLVYGGMLTTGGNDCHYIRITIRSLSSLSLATGSMAGQALSAQLFYSLAYVTTIIIPLAKINGISPHGPWVGGGKWVRWSYTSSGPHPTCSTG